MREYWIVDPDNETVRVYRRAPDQSFPEVARLARKTADVLATPLLAGFALGLNDLFAY